MEDSMMETSLVEPTDKTTDDDDQSVLYLKFTGV